MALINERQRAHLEAVEKAAAAARAERELARRGRYNAIVRTAFRVEERPTDPEPKLRTETPAPHNQRSDPSALPPKDKKTNSPYSR